MIRVSIICLSCCSFLLAASRCPAQDQPAPPKPQPRYWSTQWSFDDIDAGKLVSRLSKIGIDLGVPLDGKVSVRFDVGVPWTSLGDAAAYRFDGTLRSPSLRVDSLRFDDLGANVIYRNGKVTLNKLHASLNTAQSDTPGVIDGSGTAALVPRGDASAKLKIENIDLSPVTDVVMKVGAKTTNSLVQAGRVSGDVQFTVPLDSISRIETYQLHGGAQGEALKLRGLPPASLSIRDVSIEAGTLNLPRFEITAKDAAAETIQLLGSATLPLNGSGPFQFEIAGDDVPTQAVASLLQSTGTETPADGFSWVAGKLDFHGTGSGRFTAALPESQWDIHAAVASPGLRVAGVDLGVLEHDLELTPTKLSIAPKRPVDQLPDSVKIREVICDYQIGPDAVIIDALDAKLFGGQVEGSATLPSNGQDNLLADLHFSGIRPTIRLPVSASTPPEFTLSLAGDVKWRVPVTSLNQPAAHQGTARLRVDDMRLADESVGQLTLALSAQEGEISVRGEGEILDGTVRVNMAATTTPQDRWSDVIGRLHKSEIQLSDLSIGSLLSLVQTSRSDVSGKLSGTLSGTSLPTLGSVGELTRVEVDMTDLRYHQTLISRRLTARGGFDGRVLSIDSLVGDYAGGTIRTNGRLEIEQRDNGLKLRTDLTARVAHMDLQRGLFFIPTVSDQLGGKASGTMRLSGHAQSLRVRGNIVARQLVVSKIPLGTAHSGLHYDIDVMTSRWKLRLPTITARVGGGSLEGDLEVSSSHRGVHGVNLSSRWKTRRVDFFRLSDQLGQANNLATGQITGEITLGGKSVRSIDDIAGRFRFRLGETRGGAVPGLVGAGRWLGPVSLATEKFDVGEARGVIGNGILTMDEFWLGSDAALVRADGRIFLKSKRLEMEALIATGDYRDVAYDVQQLAQRYLLRTLLPGSAILDISELLRDRTLVVRILGRIDHPIVRLQTAETFREEAARFLIRESGRLILVGAGVGIAGGF